MDRSLFPAFQMMNDYISNYTDGNIDQNNRIRALNRAIEDIHRQLGLTCDETIFTYLYSQDNMYTNLPEDFDEPIGLVYQKKGNNIGNNAWRWSPYMTILQNSSTFGPWYANGYSQKLFGTTNINGTKQLIQLGANVRQGSTINAYNTTNLTTATGDAIDLAVDNNVYVNNGGSLSFTIDPTRGFGYAGILTTGFGLMSVQQALQNSGIYKVWSYLQNTDIDDIQLIMSSANGSYTFSATTQDSSQPFVADAWNRTQYQWQLVSISGSPDSQQITSYEFRYIEGAGFPATPVPYFRIDDFFLVFPDVMDLIYYTQIKGTNADGTVKKIILDELSDKPTFMQFFPDFMNMVALKAAVILLPQLAGDKDFMKMYRQDYMDQMRDLGKIYPRKRIITLGSTKLQRP